MEMSWVRPLWVSFRRCPAKRIGTTRCVAWESKYGTIELTSVPKVAPVSRATSPYRFRSGAVRTANRMRRDSPE